MWLSWSLYAAQCSSARVANPEFEWFRGRETMVSPAPERFCCGEERKVLNCPSARFAVSSFWTKTGISEVQLFRRQSQPNLHSYWEIAPGCALIICLERQAIDGQSKRRSAAFSSRVCQADARRSQPYCVAFRLSYFLHPKSRSPFIRMVIIVMFSFKTGMSYSCYLL